MITQLRKIKHFKILFFQPVYQIFMHFGRYQNFSHLLIFKFPVSKFFYLILQVSSANCNIVNCSARLLNNGSSRTSVVNNPLTALRRVFLRWLNAIFTSKKNIFSVFKGGGSFLGVNRITALFTFGGGLKACSPTSNRYSTAKKA